MKLAVGSSDSSPRTGSIEIELLFYISSVDGLGLFAARIEQLHQSLVVPCEFNLPIEVVDLG
jgi:hypothetical protein